MFQYDYGRHYRFEHHVNVLPILSQSNRRWSEFRRCLPFAGTHPTVAIPFRPPPGRSDLTADRKYQRHHDRNKLCLGSIVQQAGSVSSGSSGTNNGTSHVRGDANNGTSPRSAIIGIADKNFTVTQAVACTIVPIANGLSIRAALSATDCDSPRRVGSRADGILSQAYWRPS